MKKYGTKRVLTLHQKIFFTFLILVGYRLLSHIPLPFVNRDYIQNLVDTNMVDCCCCCSFRIMILLWLIPFEWT